MTTKTAPAVKHARLPLDHIRTDGNTQARAAEPPGVVSEYRQILKDDPEGDLQEIDVFRDNEGKHWLADGFMRHKAYGLAGRKDIPARIHHGSLREAILFAVGANAGKGRTDDDKRKAVSMLLLDDEWEQMSDREVGRHCRVGHPFVARVRRDLFSSNNEESANNQLESDSNSANLAGEEEDAIRGDSAPAAVSSPSPRRKGRDGKSYAAKKGGQKTSPAPEPSANGHARKEAPLPESAPEQEPLPPDAWGIPIQPHATAAFATLPDFNALIKKLKECAAEMSALADTEGGKHLLRELQWERSRNKEGGRWILPYLDNAIKIIEESRPSLTDCPFAFNDEGEHPEDCTLCRNARWTPPIKNRSVPASLVKAMKTHYDITEE